MFFFSSILFHTLQFIRMFADVTSFPLCIALWNNHQHHQQEYTQKSSGSISNADFLKYTNKSIQRRNVEWSFNILCSVWITSLGHNASCTKISRKLHQQMAAISVFFPECCNNASFQKSRCAVFLEFRGRRSLRAGYWNMSVAQSIKIRLRLFLPNLTIRSLTYFVNEKGLYGIYKVLTKVSFWCQYLILEYFKWCPALVSLYEVPFELLNCLET